jgi:hypothetical protein
MTSFNFSPRAFDTTGLIFSHEDYRRRHFERAQNTATLVGLLVIIPPIGSISKVIHHTVGVTQE